MSSAWEIGKSSDGTQNTADGSSLQSAFSKAQFKAENARKAKEYFTSDAFIDHIEGVVSRQAARGHKSYCYVGFGGLGIKADAKRDAAYVQKAFEKFKTKHPELNLNHIRFKGKTAVVLDTKPNSFVRRHLTARGRATL
jgi:hypothetical protein